MPAAADVQAAAERLRGVAERTPVLRFRELDELAGGPLWLKMESFQRGGAFKFRGAYHAISRNLEPARARGVVTGSSGNHGTAVAIAARLLGAAAVVVMPEDAAAVKLDAVRAAGGRVVLCGRTSDERLAKAAELAEREGLLSIPPYDHEDVIAGQGTVALEVLEQVPDLAVFLAPCGGGGLLAGCAAAISGLRPDVEIYGCEAAAANDTFLSFQRGERVRIGLPETIADGMRNLSPGALTFPIVRARCRGILLLDEREIRDAVSLLFRRAKLVAEPTGAVAPAAALFRSVDLRGRTAVAVVSGGNIDPAVLARCLEG